jgi:hypothetical protein
MKDYNANLLETSNTLINLSLSRAGVWCSAKLSDGPLCFQTVILTSSSAGILHYNEGDTSNQYRSWIDAVYQIPSVLVTTSKRLVFGYHIAGLKAIRVRRKSSLVTFVIPKGSELVGASPCLES